MIGLLEFELFFRIIQEIELLNYFDFSLSKLTICRLYLDGLQNTNQVRGEKSSVIIRSVRSIFV